MTTRATSIFGEAGGSGLGRPTLTIVAVLVYAFLYAPLLVLVIYSFSDSRVMTFPIGSVSLQWYRLLFADRDLIRSVTNSLVVATSVVPLTLLLGVPAAFALDRFDFYGKATFERVVMLPLIIPGLITGLAILLLLKRLDLPLSLATVIIGHSVAWMPIVVTQVYARLRRFDRSIEEASMDLGAGRIQTFVRITLPNLRAALLGSSLLVFTLSFDEIAITFFLTGTENTLPMHIWSMLREGVTPKINAIATITIVASIILIFIGVRLSGSERATIHGEPHKIGVTSVKHGVPAELLDGVLMECTGRSVISFQSILGRASVRRVDERVRLRASDRRAARQSPPGVLSRPNAGSAGVATSCPPIAGVTISASSSANLANSESW